MRHVAVALLLGAVAVPAFCQDAQSLVAKNLEARGGEQALAAIKTIRFHGRSIYPGDFELTYEETRARTGAEAAGRTDLTIQGLDLVQAYDGHGDGWKINPFQGRKDPERMSATRLGRLPTQRLSRGRCSHREPTGAMSNILAGTISKAL